MFGIDIKAARIVWTVALVTGLLYGLYAMRSTLLVLVFAIFFSYFVYPLVQMTQRRVGPQVPREAVIAVVFAVVLGIIVVAVTAFGSRVADEASTLSKELPQLLDTSTIANRIPLPAFLDPFRNRLVALINDLSRAGRGQILPTVQQIGTGVVRTAAQLVYIAVVPILSFLLIKEAPSIKEQVLAWTGKSSSLFWKDILEDMNVLLSRYVRALLLLSLAALIVYSAVLSLLGAPFPLLLAGIAALLEVIPVIGPLVAACVILAVAAFSGYEHVWWLLAFVVIYRIFQDYMLNPYLMSEGVEVPPALVVVGLLAGDELAGVAGIFLSIPVLAAAKIVLQRMRRADNTKRKIGGDQAQN